MTRTARQRSSRRHVLKVLAESFAAATAGLALGAARAQGQDYPARPIKLLCAFAAGGGADNLTRVIADKLAPELGQPLVVDNRPGATGMIAAREAMRSPPDGYTLLVSFTLLVQNQLLYGAKAGYDVFQSFVPVARLMDAMGVLVCTNGLAVRSVADFVAASKVSATPLTYATQGVGSSGHLYSEIIAKNTGARLVHVPYKGESQLLPDVISGRVQAAWVSGATAQRLLRSGQARVLATTAQKRHPALPDVPTFMEIGYTFMEAEGWLGVFAPVGTARPLVERLAAEFDKAVKLPDVRAKIFEAGLAPGGGSSEEFERAVRKSHTDWGRIIGSAGITLQE